MKDTPKELISLIQTTELLKYEKTWTKRESGILELWREAQKCEWSLRELARVAFLSTSLLEELTKKRPKEIRALAAKEIQWPMLTTKNRSGLLRLVDDLEKLCLGTEIFAPLDSSKFQCRDGTVRTRLLQYTGEIKMIRGMGQSLKSLNKTPNTERSLKSKGSRSIEEVRLVMEQGIKQFEEALEDAESHESKIARLPDLSTATISDWLPYILELLLVDTDGLSKLPPDLENITRSKPDNPRDAIRTRFRQILTSVVKSST